MLDPLYFTFNLISSPPPSLFDGSFNDEQYWRFWAYACAFIAVFLAYASSLVSWVMAVFGYSGGHLIEPSVLAIAVCWAGVVFIAQQLLELYALVHPPSRDASVAFAQHQNMTRIIQKVCKPFALLFLVNLALNHLYSSNGYDLLAFVGIVLSEANQPKELLGQYCKLMNQIEVRNASWTVRAHHILYVLMYCMLVMLHIPPAFSLCYITFSGGITRFLDLYQLLVVTAWVAASMRLEQNRPAHAFYRGHYDSPENEFDSCISLKPEVFNSNIPRSS